MKKILVNVNSIVLYSGKTHLPGIGRSTYSLLKALSEKDHLPFDIVLYSQRVKQGGLKGYNFSYNQLRVPLPNKSLFTRLVNGFRVKELLTKYELYHIPHNTDYVAVPERTLFTIHDLMIYRFPEYFPFTTKFEAWAKKMLKNCHAVVTCSESSKNDISYYWEVPLEKISVIEWGIDRNVFYPSSSEEKENVRQKYGIHYPYFLSVSNSHPRKNLKLVLAGFREFVRGNQEARLIILCGNPSNDFQNEYRKEIEAGNIVFLDHVSDEELRSLYSGAVATLFPSLYEGFGFPVLESLACHTPVITCSNSSLKELGADLAIYTSENDIGELANHLSTVFQDRSRFVNTEKIERHLERFSWENTAEDYIKLYSALTK